MLLFNGMADFALEVEDADYKERVGVLLSYSGVVIRGPNEFLLSSEFESKNRKLIKKNAESIRSCLTVSKFPADPHEGFEYWELKGSDYDVNFEVEFVTESQLALQLGNFRYKNNLADYCRGYIFYVSGSSVNVLSAGEGVPGVGEAVFLFETAPAEVTNRENLQIVMNAVWQEWPFSLNYLKVDRFLGEDVVVAASDSGRVFVWQVKKIVAAVEVEVERQKQVQMLPEVQRINRGTVHRVAAEYEFKVGASAWGVDLCGRYVAVSDNNRVVSVFHVSDDGAVLKGVSGLMLSNVPLVSFMQHERGVYVAAGTILGELSVFEVTMVGGILSVVEAQEFQLTSGVWTVHSVSGELFKQVRVLDYPGYNEDAFVDCVYSKSRFLDGESDPVESSDLGVAAGFAYVYVGDDAVADVEKYCFNLLQSPDTVVLDTYSRVVRHCNRFYTDVQRGRMKTHVSLNGRVYWQPTINNGPRHYWLVTTESRLGLFDCNELICNASTDELFDVAGVGCNRISFAKYVPEISCLVIGTPAGYVAVFRLVRFRGVYSFKKVCKFPEAGNAVGEMSGLVVRKLGEDYYIYMIHYNGQVMVYKLAEVEAEEGLLV